MHAQSLRCDRLLQPYGLQSAMLLCPWDFPGKNTGASCHFLLQGICLIQGANSCLLHLLHWQANSISLSHRGSPMLSSTFLTFSQNVRGWVWHCISHSWLGQSITRGHKIQLPPPKTSDSQIKDDQSQRYSREIWIKLKNETIKIFRDWDGDTVHAWLSLRFWDCEHMNICIICFT